MITDNRKFAELGFKTPDYIENSYGIKIYIGTIGQEDWCIEIPRQLTDEIYKTKYKQNLAFYLVSEQMAWEMAEKYTQIAKMIARRGI